MAEPPDKKGHRERGKLTHSCHIQYCGPILQTLRKAQQAIFNTGVTHSNLRETIYGDRGQDGDYSWEGHTFLSPGRGGPAELLEVLGNVLFVAGFTSVFME